MNSASRAQGGASAPTLTIGLPVYNGEDVPEAVPRFLLAQTLSDFELIISDNASTDATAEDLRGVRRT